MKDYNCPELLPEARAYSVATTDSNLDPRRIERVALRRVEIGRKDNAYDSYELKTDGR